MGDIIVAIDIGTSKVCTLVGKVHASNTVEIIGEGLEPCSGVKKGIIVDIDSTASSIRRSVKQAEAAAGVKVGSAYVNIAGAHIDVAQNTSAINIAGDNHEIAAKDVERIMAMVGNVQLPQDRQVIDVIPRQFIIDGYDEIIDPVGMVGVKLEVDADIISGRITSVQNIVRSLERADVKLDGIVVDALASSEILLTPDEKDMGVVLIDVGGGITDVSVVKNKRLIFNDSVPVGGDHITSDISIGLRIAHSEAEKLKRQFELALTSLIKNDQEVSITDINDNRRKSVKVSEIVEIIEARVYEIFSLCRGLLEKSDIKEQMFSTIVLTGGGISYVDGSLQLAREIFNTQVRLVNLRNTDVSKLEYTTAAGIVRLVANSGKTGSRGSEVKIIKQEVKKKENKLIKLIAKIFNSFF